METREPYQIGEVGEEVVGALDSEPLILEPLVLSRPDAEGFPWLFVLVMFATAIVVGTLFRHFNLGSGLTKREEEFVLNLLLFLPASLLEWVRWIKRSKAPDLHLLIERGNEAVPLSETPLEFWKDSGLPNSHYQQLIPRILCGLAIFIFSCILIWGEGWDVRIGAIIGLIFVLLYALGPGRANFSPLLIIGRTSVTIANKEIDWSRVGSVEVSHKLNSDRSFSSIQLVFRGLNRQNLGSAILPKEQCSVGAELSLLKYIGQLLGRRIKTVAPDQPNWI